MARALLSLIALLLCAACNSPAEIRYHCIRSAHHAVGPQHVDSEARKRMVHEAYLRCLEAHDVPDAPPNPPQY